MENIVFAITQLITVIAMIAATFVVYKAFGSRGNSFVYTQEEKRAWDNLVSNALGSWLTGTNIAATLTSLATVYIFFIGNTKLFGFTILVTVVTIWGGAFVTKHFTEILSSNAYYRELLRSGESAAAVIAAVFWQPNAVGRQNSAIVRYISLINISCIIWLEFSVFSDISGQLLAEGDLLSSCALMFISTLTISYFTFRYGLRGFVFADFFHSPLILVGSIALLLGVFSVAQTHEESILPKLMDMKTYYPVLSWQECVLFVIATAFLNAFLVITSQSHWLRVWTFGSKITSLQVRSLSGTAVIWVILIMIGLLAGMVTEGAIGKDAVAKLIELAGDQSLLYVVAFWVVGTAVLFSTADTQFYSFLLVRYFDVGTGRLSNTRINEMKPLFNGLATATLFTAIYFLVTFFQVPFEKLVFLMLPISMICVPAFIGASLRQQPSPRYLWLSIALYLMCTILALAQPADEFFFSIAAPLMPAVVSVLVLVRSVLSRSA